jgi:hypothetical protein
MFVPTRSIYPDVGPPTQRGDLPAYLDWIWQHYFSDVERINEVLIRYCYPWKSRLGLIRLSLDNTTSFIGINSLLRASQVPEYVLVTTIAHELVHYAQGFGSPHPRTCNHPHANKVVEKELERRALGSQLHFCDEWIDKYWYSFYDRQRETGWACLPGRRNPVQRNRKQE